MARDVQQLKRLTPSLLPRFPAGCCAHRKELALWLRKDGCQVRFDDVASHLEARGAVRWLLDSRATRLRESTTQVLIDASLCSLMPSHGRKEVLRIDSDHM